TFPFILTNRTVKKQYNRLAVLCFFPFSFNVVHAIDAPLRLALRSLYPGALQYIAEKSELATARLVVPVGYLGNGTIVLDECVSAFAQFVPLDHVPLAILQLGQFLYPVF